MLIKGDNKENVLPSHLPTSTSPNSSKRNVTFNIYEEVHGDRGREFKLINEKGKISFCLFCGNPNLIAYIKNVLAIILSFV